jgi:DNA-directed RNA polymerase specialized sigma24 family protein
MPAAQAEDMLSVIFLHLYANFHLYIGEKERLFTWMYKITLTICDEAASSISEDLYTPDLPPTEPVCLSLA